jgi:hypothetical protein
MGDWYNVYDGVFFISLATLFFGCLSLTIKTCYKSKCKTCRFCGGMFFIERDTENEEKIDIEANDTGTKEAEEEKK